MTAVMVGESMASGIHSIP